VNTLIPALQVELLKVRRSRMPLFTVLAFSLAPFAGGFFMIVLKDPELARRLGMISAKAQIVAGSADWQTYLGMMAQATAIGGIILFSFIASWVFGREYSDHTIKDLLALPTPRPAIVFAKFIVITVWSVVLIAIIYGIALLAGAALSLPEADAKVFEEGTVTVAITVVLTIALITPIAFFACAGHGYLLPMGVAILVLILAQLVAAAGWGEYFPWSIPALRMGMAGPQYAAIGLASYLIVVLTGLAGALGTFLWWERADQTQ
jgi:ABC-2 type transport system permease protein